MAWYEWLSCGLVLYYLGVLETGWIIGRVAEGEEGESQEFMGGLFWFICYAWPIIALFFGVVALAALPDAFYRMGLRTRNEERDKDRRASTLLKEREADLERADKEIKELKDKLHKATMGGLTDRFRNVG